MVLWDVERSLYSILLYSTLFYSTLFYSILFYSILFYNVGVLWFYGMLSGHSILW